MISTQTIAAFGLGIAVIGWWAAHYFTAIRDIRNKQREQRISYLIEAFKDLNYLRIHASSLDIKDLSTILIRITNNIELFGTQHQIDQFRELAQDVSDSGKLINVHDLINSLRNDLRTMIGLDSVSGSVSYFAVKRLPCDEFNNSPQ